MIRVTESEYRLVSIIIVAMLSGCCCCPKKSPEQMEKARVAKEAKKAKKAAEKAKLKKKCGKHWGATHWETACIGLVRKRLTHPSSASFSYLMSVSRLSNEKTCKMFYSSTVESKNAFGTMIKHWFRCSYDPKKNWVKLEYLESRK